MVDVDLKAFLAERDEIMLQGDLDRMIAFHARWNPGRPSPSRDIAEISLHKARTAAKSLPMEVRSQSKKWLLERGYQSMDDGDVP